MSRIRSGDTFVDDRFSKASGELSDELPGLRWVGFDLTFQDFKDTGESDTNATVDLGSIPTGCAIHNVALNLIAGFDAAVTLSDAVLEIGDDDDPNGFLAGNANLDDNGGTVGWQTVDLANLGAYLKNDIATTPAVDEREPLKLYSVSTKTLKATLTITGDTINDMNAGQVKVYVLLSFPGAAYAKPLS